MSHSLNTAVAAGRINAGKRKYEKGDEVKREDVGDRFFAELLRKGFIAPPKPSVIDSTFEERTEKQAILELTTRLTGETAGRVAAEREVEALTARLAEETATREAAEQEVKMLTARLADAKAAVNNDKSGKGKSGK